MDSTFFLYLGRHTLETALLLVAPVLVICMVVGIVMTLIQAVTSIRDMTLTIVPKLLSMGFVLLIFGNWMLSVVLKFTIEVFGYMQNTGH
jgi:flagellar biosynthetic protein FliQ